VRLRTAVSVLAVMAGIVVCNAKSQGDIDELRSIELKRTRALVEADMKTARQLLADDFQLITPMGGVLSKQEYLAQVESGAIDYLEWKPETIEVKALGDAAVIRYRAAIRIVVKAAPNAPQGRIWFTDLYEKRKGQWQIVWSQGTQAQ